RRSAKCRLQKEAIPEPVHFVAYRQYPYSMGTPSNYELAAWDKIQDFKPRPLSGTFNKANEKLVEFGSTVASTSSKFVSDHPKLQKAASGITDTAQKGVTTMASGGMKLLNGI